MSTFRRFGFFGTTLALVLANAAQAQSTVKVGVLHSLTGTMAISEITVANAAQLAVDEINAKGGVLGKKIVVVKEDGASDWPTFATKAEKLLTQDRVAAVFGGWTSASRKAMLPVFEKNRGLLFYPVQFEGNECSPNIIYTGAQPNQQALPALEWALGKGHKNIFLLGSDYVYPRTANLILKKHIAAKGAKLAGEEYVALGGTEFSSVINKIKAAKPDIIINTLNGDSNVSFFKQYQAAGYTAKTLPVISFSIAEQEAQSIGPALLTNQYATWNYFQSLPNAANQKFVGAYQAKYGKNAAITDPMAHAYMDVYLWKAAVEKAKSFDATAVRKAIVGVSLQSPLGKITVAPNGSLIQAVYTGQSGAGGQFKTVAQSQGVVTPQPYDKLAFPGKSCP
ncbi:urea ABC transporter substrate-binding protein [Deinococcus hopiensis]|uniref:Urea transport system substrate-binding protein n=1 Tax=Deinococcus hopiensis KR-140 TaxID=695939 RepID=A0A1W1UCF1_9DEIO|nr:urea ABC transporter substrate-binding protein [Deinococcus hopiensis]SMB78747.1 urea transport system substrate-binding protein [Deinococcus hopiensis KR-140]